MWIVVSMILAACSLGLVGWWLGWPYVRAGEAGEPSQPWPVRTLWPWVEAVADLLQPYLSWHARARLERLLHQAGAAAYWSPHHLRAWQALLAVLAASGATLLLRDVLSPTGLLLGGATGGVLAAIWPVQHLRDRIRRRKQAMLREFPFLLDMITLCVEAGLNFHGALQQAAQHGPAGPLKDELLHLLADIRAGATRLEALEDWARRCDLPCLHYFVAAVAQAEHTGMSLGAVLRAQADQHRSERFQQAEKQALEAPVKMMFPLVFCIFPCSFLIIAFPIVVQFLGLWEG